MKKLIIIPAYNEQDCIKNTVETILKEAPEFDYIVINDCSTDSTAEILKQNNFNYINLPVNLGIGGAVQTGYRYAYLNGYEYAVQVDGDGQHDPRFLEQMSQYLKKTDADMVIGSRFIENEGFQSTMTRRIGIKYFTWLIRMITGRTITDPTSGLRMINKSAIKVFAFDYPKDYPEPESTTHILRLGMQVEEIPVLMKERQGGVSSINLRKSIYYMIKVSLAILLKVFVTVRKGKR